MAPELVLAAYHVGDSPMGVLTPLSPHFGMIVALASSTAFMAPISSPVNMLVVGPGNCAFSDFLRTGTPLAFIVLVLSVLLVPWLLPLH